MHLQVSAYATKWNSFHGVTTGIELFAICHRFAVTPLTEDCGLVEWVHNLTALRTAITESLTSEGLWSKSTNPYIKTLYDNFQARCRVLRVLPGLTWN
jgi:hypothetical protein